MTNSLNIFLPIDRQNYKELVGITPDNPNYYKIAFINDGSGIITKGQLYCASPYFIEVVDTLPQEQQEDVIYFVKES